MSGLASQAQIRASVFRWSLFTVPAFVLLGSFAGRLSGSGPGNPWFDALQKPDLYPDPIWFGIVWGTLYVLMGIAVALVGAAWGARGRTAALVSFGVLFVLLLGWSPLFFAFQQITLALVLLGVVVANTLLTVLLFAKVRKLAAWLMVPLLAWTSFATLLNYEFLRLNPEFDGANPTQAQQRIEF
ncbi:MAG: TspO/MBR family protein [Sphingomonadaceae bacterium]